MSSPILPTQMATQGALNPPYCNTGGYKSSSNITLIDWLRITTSSLECFKNTYSELEGEHGLLTTAGIDIKWSDKGLHGYEESAVLQISNDKERLTIGHIATSEKGGNRGGMLELSGVGCKILQLEYPELWEELHGLLVRYEWRITRTDIALDLSGEYCKENGLTVPKLFRAAVDDGLFKSDKTKNPNMVQSVAMAGDWSPLVVGSVTVDSYNPLEHCHGGLTGYIGNRKSSDDFFRIYEKGKEILGKEAGAKGIDRGWVRIEHEMKRAGSKRVIPLNVMINPDKYFCSSRSKVREIMHQLRESFRMQKVDNPHIERFKTEKGLLLSKKIHWARFSYGRLIRTLANEGKTLEEIFSDLARKNGLKEFVYDIGESPQYDPATGEWIKKSA